MSEEEKKALLASTTDNLTEVRHALFPVGELAVPFPQGKELRLMRLELLKWCLALNVKPL